MSDPNFTAPGTTAPKSEFQQMQDRLKNLAPPAPDFKEDSKTLEDKVLGAKKDDKGNVITHTVPGREIKAAMTDLEKGTAEAIEKAERDFRNANPPGTKPPKPGDDAARLLRMKEVSDRMGQILQEYGGEGNIPVVKDHEYWGLRDELLRLQKKNN